MDDYLSGKCQVLAIGYEDTSMDTNFLERMCTNELVYTTSVVAEIPMAFPLRQGISSGVSYWKYRGERLGVSLQTSKDEFPTQVGCDVHHQKKRKEMKWMRLQLRTSSCPLSSSLCLLLSQS